MSPVYTPEKRPPKLDRFCYLSHPAQRVMIALYQDYIQRKQDLLRCLNTAPAEPAHQSYYQSLYRSRFGASPTVTDQTDHDTIPQRGNLDHSPEQSAYQANEARPSTSSTNLDNLWIPSDTSTYSDSPPIETQGYRILSQFHQHNCDTSLETIDDRSRENPVQNRDECYGLFDTSITSTVSPVETENGDKQPFSGSQSLFSQDDVGTCDPSIPSKAKPRKHTTTGVIAKKCHQMQQRYEKSTKSFHIDREREMHKDRYEKPGPTTSFNVESEKDWYNKGHYKPVITHQSFVKENNTERHSDIQDISNLGVRQINERTAELIFHDNQSYKSHTSTSFNVDTATNLSDTTSMSEHPSIRIDNAGDRNHFVFDTKQTEDDTDDIPGMLGNLTRLNEEHLDNSFKKMAAADSGETDVRATDKRGDVPVADSLDDELPADMESPFVEKPVKLFPMFVRENKMGQKSSERRQQDNVQKASEKRKKLPPSSSFAAPFKKQKLAKLSTVSRTETFKEGQLLNIDSLSLVELQQLLSEILQYEEVVIVLIYKDGTTQLREALFGNEKRNGSKAKQGNVEVDGFAIASRSTQQRHIFTFPVKYQSQHFDTIKEFWNQLLKSPNRKIGFHVKDTLTTIMKIYKFDHQKVDMTWTMLDPIVGQWLLDSDKPLSEFEAILHAVNLPEQVPSNDCLDVLYEDMMLLGKAMEKIIQKLKSKDMLDLYLCIETKLVNLLAGMEMRQLHTATHTLIKFSDILKKKLKKLEQKAHQSAGHSFLLSSHAQLRQVLFEELHLDAQLPQKTKVAKTSVGKEKSTSEAVLTQLSPFHELPGIVLEHRQLQKLKSTYIDGILSCIKNETLTTNWDQTAAATGRLTSYQPNIQAIPKQPVTISGYKDNYIADKEVDDTVEIYARDAFVSRPGFSFVSADFQQIELRLLAHLADDPILIQNFNDPNNPDIFNALTAQWLGKPVEEVSSSDREQTKRVVYSVMYGAGKEKLAEYLKISPENAKAIISSFLKKFPAVSQFTKKCVDYCKKNGYTSSIFRRRRSFPNINHPSSWLRAQAERQCVNFCIQGSAADICKAAMIQIEDALATNGNVDAQLLVQIHDELLIEVADENIQNVIEVIQEVMQCQEKLCGSMVKLRVPIPVSVSVGKKWGQMKNI